MKRNNTKEKITQACLELLNNRSLVSLRSQDIIEKAGVSRSSFYRLFLDKYEVANWVYKEQIDAIVKEAPTLRDWTKWTIVEHDYMRSHKQFFRNIASYRGQNSFEEFLFQYYADNSLKFRTNISETLTEDQMFANRAFSLIGARTTIEWILHDFQPDDATMIRQLEMCIPPCIRSFYV